MKATRLLLLALGALLIAFFAIGCAKEPEPAPSDPAPASSSGGGEGEQANAPTGKPDEEPTDVQPTDGDYKPTREPKDGEDVVVIETEKGKIVAHFFPDRAPNHVKNFLSLAKSGFYDGTRFHRCIPGFMIQGGDPQSKDLSKAQMWGMGGNTKDGKEQNVKAEFTDEPHKRGILSMARAQDPDSASSQFFIMHQDYPALDNQYSVFGEVISGIGVVDAIVQTGDPNNNGAVNPQEAVVVKSMKVTKWPVK